MSESVSVGLLLNEPSESFGVCEWLIQCLWVTCHPPLCVYVCVFYLSGVCVIRSSRVLKRPVSSLCSRWLRWAWSLSASPCDWICVCACSSALSNKFSRVCDSYTHTRIHSYLTMWSVNYCHLIPPDSAEHNLMTPSLSSTGTTTKNSSFITNSSFSNTRNLNPAYNLPTNSHSRDKSRFYTFWWKCVWSSPC